MVFWLKKMVSGFLLPLPVGLFFMAVGLALLVMRRASCVRNTCLFISLLVITLFSTRFVADALLNGLQSQYTPLMQISPTVTQVVVLGGGISGGKNYPPNLMLNAASLSRLVEGIRLFKEVEKNNAQAQLILSGGRVFQAPAIAGKMRNTAVMLGIDPTHILLENGSQDTHQEAVFLQKTLHHHPFILVTSAYHMPRAMALFQHLGMHPIAAPTQFLGFHRTLITAYLPNTNNLVISDIALHEYLGVLWEKMQGYISA